MTASEHNKDTTTKPQLQRHREFLKAILSWEAALPLFLMVSISLVEGLGLLMLIPLLQLVGLDVQQGSMGRIASLISGALAAVSIRPTLIVILAIYVLVITGQSLLIRWQTLVNTDLLCNVIVRLRQRLYRAITMANWLFICRSRSSDFTHRLTTEIDRVGSATHSLLSLISYSLVTFAYVLLAMQLSAIITVLVFVCGLVLLLLVESKARAARLAGERFSQATNELYSASIEHMEGLKTVKSYGAEERTLSIFSGIVRQVRQQHLNANRNRADAAFWFSVGCVLILSLILYVSFKIFALPTTTVLLLLFLYARIMPRFSSIQQSYQYLMHDLPAFDSVMEMCLRCEAAVEPGIEVLSKIELRDALVFDRVCFTYERSDLPVIRNVDIAIAARQTTAIIGPSGAGKSTIADLVMGLLMPGRGSVRIDETELTAENLQGWRVQIGYVAQDTFLFHDSIRANLLWARPRATDEEIFEALRLAAADDFIAQLPKGIETVVGDRGVRLSGGERQRLALARALLRSPSLLILDEATSALDSENERRIQRAIDELHGNLTILVITHRLSTIRNADMIYVLEQGAVVESGDWATLAAKENGRFRELCRAQDIAVKAPAEQALKAI